MTDTEVKWWLKPVRMMRRDYISDFTRLLRADLAAMARETKTRWHANCEWIMATPGCSPGMAEYATFNSVKFKKFPRMGSFDLLRQYLPHARKNSVRLVPYINLHWYSYAYARAHPGWEQLLEDGTPYGVKNPLYGAGTTFCVNTSWREWAFDLLREVMRTGVDGCFLDGPAVFPGACYCACCRRLFSAETGRERMPSFNDWSDPWFRRFLRFRVDSMAAFLRDARAAVREINADGIVFLNGGHCSSNACQVAHEPEKTEEYQDFTGAEEFFHCSEEYRSPFRTLNLARFLSAGKRPAVVFTHHTMSTWHYVPLHPPEMRLALAQTVAGGANPWFAIFMDSMATRSAEAFSGVEPIQSFLDRSEKYIAGSTPAADVAVLTSRSTLTNYISRLGGISRDIGSGQERNLVQERGTGLLRAGQAALRKESESILNNGYEGCFDALTHSHIPLRVIWDKYLDDGHLKGVKVIVAPNPACLDESHVRALINFVNRGGGLVVTFEGGFYDEFGKPAARPEWMKFLGIRAVRDAFAPSRTEDYMTITSALLPSFRRNMLVPRTYHAMQVVPARDASVLAVYNRPIGLSYRKMTGRSRFPAITFARRGRGKIAYVSAPLFHSFGRFRLEDHRRIAEDLVRLVHPERGMLVETDAPGSLAVEARENEAGLQLHLVNATGDMKRPIASVVPLANIGLSVRANYRRVRALAARQEIPFRRRAGRMEFRGPVVREYEILAFEK